MIISLSFVDLVLFLCHSCSPALLESFAQCNIIIHCLSVRCCQLPFLYLQSPVLIIFYYITLHCWCCLFITEFIGELSLLSLCCCSGSLNNAAISRFYTKSRKPTNPEFNHFTSICVDTIVVKCLLCRPAIPLIIVCRMKI